VQQQFIRRRKIDLDEEEMIMITQSVPGIIACNCAIYVGSSVNGIAGAFSAVAGAILPSILIILLIASGLSAADEYLASEIAQRAFRGITSAVSALVLVTAYRMIKKSVRDAFDLIIMSCVFISVAVFDVNPPLLIIFALAMGVLKVSLSIIPAGRQASKCVGGRKDSEK
jgi:chromate transporter